MVYALRGWAQGAFCCLRSNSAAQLPLASPCLLRVSACATLYATYCVKSAFRKFNAIKKKFKKFAQILCGFSIPTRFVADKTAANGPSRRLERKPILGKENAQGITFACLIVLVVTTTGLSSASYAAEREGPQLHDFNISEPNVAEALNLFAEQTGAVLLFPYDLVEGRPAKPLKGRYDVTEALDILLEGSGLSGSLVEGEVIRISLGDDKTQADREDEMASGKLEKGLLASVAAFVIGGAQAQEIETIDEPEGEEQERQEQDVIIVTGTNIRGVMLESSPSFVFDREAIERTGVSTTEQFIEKLPQNFSGLSETSRFAGSSDNNVGTATGANLRGLGADSTLTLLNGHRLAPGSIGNAVDLSMIPLAIIERVDIITDGASAIYGSDAIGGVVNFVLRDDFEGVEAQANYGFVTEGELEERGVTLMGGFNWGSGNLIASYDYLKTDQLLAAEKDFAREAGDPVTLLPGEERNTFLVNLKQNFGERIAFSLSGLYSAGERNLFTNNLVLGGTQLDFLDIDSEEISINPGLSIELPGDWRVALSGNVADNFSVNRRIDISGQGFGVRNQRADSNLASAGLILDGPLFALPAGQARLAAGGEYRTERFLTDQAPERSREVTAFFGELFLPLIGEANALPGARRIEVSAAVRHDDYDDFGSAMNPKIGVLWSPVDDLILRGSYGTSFRPPLLGRNDTADFGPATLILPNPDAPSGVSPIALVSLGPVQDLEPEESENLSFGLDYARQFGDASLALSATYYRIEFAGLIGIPPSPDGNFFKIISDRDQLPAEIVFENPSQAELDALFGLTNGVIDNFAGLELNPDGSLDAAKIDFLFDFRERNLARAVTRGLDFSLSGDVETDIGAWSAALNVNYILDLDRQASEETPNVEFEDTLFFPANLKFRGQTGWRNGPYTATVFFNYTDDYVDNRGAEPVVVDAYTTIDFTMRYRFEDAAPKLLSGTDISVSVINAFDRDPPEVLSFNDTTSLTTFDAANAEPRGRFISLTLRKAW